MFSRPKKILLTGGPCGGKTTILAKLQAILDNKGYRVFCVPEAATLLMKGGMQLDTSRMSYDFKVRSQTSLLQTQKSMEDVFMQVAENTQAEENKPAVVFCDRGLFDGKAYVEPELWSQIIDEQGWVGLNFIDKRYDAVIHMVTAADGAEQFYDYSNEARYETVEQARDRDLALREAYLGHHRYFIVDNEDDFQAKLNKGIKIVNSVLGLPTDVKFFQKYLVDTRDFGKDHSKIDFPEGILLEQMTILETYLPPPMMEPKQKNMSLFIKKRSKNGLYTYSIEKRYNVGQERIQELQTLTAKDYLEALRSRDMKKRQIAKFRTHFNYGSNYFTLETVDIKGYPTFLRCETSSKKVELPPFIKILKDISHDDKYKTRSLAMMDD